MCLRYCCRPMNTGVSGHIAFVLFLHKCPLLGSFWCRPRGRMPRVECMALAGLELWFNSEDHGPPHFHVRKPDRWEIRVFFRSCTRRELSFSVKYSFRAKGPTGKEPAAILRTVMDNLAELTLEWEQKVQTER